MGRGKAGKTRGADAHHGQRLPTFSLGSHLLPLSKRYGASQVNGITCVYSAVLGWGGEGFLSGLSSSCNSLDCIASVGQWSSAGAGAD